MIQLVIAVDNIKALLQARNAALYDADHQSGTSISNQMPQIFRYKGLFLQQIDQTDYEQCFDTLVFAPQY